MKTLYLAFFAITLSVINFVSHAESLRVSLSYKASLTVKSCGKDSYKGGEVFDMRNLDSGNTGYVIRPSYCDLFPDENRACALFIDTIGTYEAKNNRRYIISIDLSDNPGSNAIDIGSPKICDSTIAYDFTNTVQTKKLKLNKNRTKAKATSSYSARGINENGRSIKATYKYKANGNVSIHN